MKVFALDLSICNGCYCCQIACKDEHVGNDWMPYARPQPDTGQFWVKVQENIRGTVPKVRVSYIPQMCMHCDDAPCIPVCKPSAIYRRDDGLVVINPEKCTGCKLCSEACPHDAIYFNEDMNIAQKCTGCAHLLDDGWDVPRCVDACASGALKFGEESEFEEQIAATADEQPKGCKGRVFYMNWPKTFVAGTVYEPIWLHTSEAAKRGIQHGDIIKIFNERGTVLGGAYVTERLRPGVTYIDHGARIDPIILGKVDRGGAINTIAPTGTTSKNAVGQATSGYLVEVAKVTGAEWDEWRRINPEAFARSYDAASGLRFEAWVVQEGGEK